MNGRNRAERIVIETLDRAAINMAKYLSISATEIRSILQYTETEMKCPKKLHCGKICGVILCPHHGHIVEVPIQ